MVLCRLKHSELAKHLQTCKGRVVLWEDYVKDDGECKAAFSEQRPAASHMAAAAFLDTVPRPHGMAGEADDAASAYTQVHLLEVSTL